MHLPIHGLRTSDMKRIRIYMMIYFLGFVVIIGRLFFWQIIKGKELSLQARSQYEIGQVIQAPRGNILASDGTWLVARGKSYLVYASLPDISDNTQSIADKLAPLFLGELSEEQEDEKEELLLREAARLTKLLTKKEVVWVPLKNRVSKETKQAVEDLHIEGIGFQEEEARMYPEASTAAHVLGFVGKNDHGEDVGYFGLEGYYNLILSGKPGYVAQESDARGIPILLGSSREVFAVNGIDLKTSIDKVVQLSLENGLKKGMEIYGAVSATGIVMDPVTGEIYGMASFPSYDPEEYFDWSDEFFKNPAVSDSFEPGSIFKVLVMAAGIDAGEIEPDTKCDICDKPVKVDKYYINTWNNEYNADATMTDVIVHSDNVGMVFVGKRLGTERLISYIQNFGIGSLTGIDLQGEATPALRDPQEWSEVDTATATFGQGIATTPLQMVRAVAAIANGGYLVTPHIVTDLVGDGWDEPLEVSKPKRILSEMATKKTTAMMVEAAKNGESKWTYVQGFKVAGKTGTAQIPIQGHYDSEKTIASFVGFAPYDNPKFIMLITLREPQSSPWASETAAPLWYSISRDLFKYYGIQPES